MGIMGNRFVMQVKMSVGSEIEMTMDVLIFPR
jgi:hypothetical protein